MIDVIYELYISVLIFNALILDLFLSFFLSFRIFFSSMSIHFFSLKHKKVIYETNVNSHCKLNFFDFHIYK